MTARPSIVIVTDDPRSWGVPYNLELVERLRAMGGEASLVHDVKQAPDVDIAVYLNCIRIVPPAQLARFRHNLVVHASDLPRGRGWSPMTWRVVEGAQHLTLSLLEAQEAVDAGPIYLQREVPLEGHELVDELRVLVARGSQDLVMDFLARWPHVEARPQEGEATFYPRRREADNKLDADRPLRESFNLLRVTDNERYPAFFEHAGHIYELRITKRGPAR